ncbi:GT2 family glycosyltransferase [Sulfurisoma sediminicola]|uniref:GT2 family glycosyltransferase n=2 Tax=Sulfurisoma sediminicola TaxID=1381557 RepID=A0A497XM67_9PROT|nr:GT2 family glycosyltransferase [Sulfurisoma sediminicola]
MALVQVAVSRRSFAHAAILADRLRRLVPQQAEAWALVGACGLRVAHGIDPITAYKSALVRAPDRKDFIVGYGYALLAADRCGDFQEELNLLIQRHLFDPMVAEFVLDFQLASGAGLVAAAHVGPAGWLTGWAWNRARPDEPQRVNVTSDGEPLFELAATEHKALLKTKGVGDGCFGFRHRLPADAKPPIVLECGGEAIPGSPLGLPPRQEGFLEFAESGRVYGWARDRRHPNRPVSVVIRNNLGDSKVVEPSEVRPDLSPDGHAVRTGFIADFGEPPADVRLIRYEAHFADTKHPLHNSPLWVTLRPHTDAALRQLAAWLRHHQPQLEEMGLSVALQTLLRRDVLPAACHNLWRPRRPQRPLPDPVSQTADRAGRDIVVDVIVPVYRGLQETIECIESVLAAPVSTPFELILVDDASPEPELSAALVAYAKRRGVVLLRNEENKGFVGSVNRALMLHPARDVVLLNSDTRVHGDWLDRIVATANLDRDIGTITPLSNDATICSYPVFNDHNAFPNAQNLMLLDGDCARVNPPHGIDIPTAVGSCMYIRRDCIDDVGLFDEATWGKGYGEENDFSLRASYLGWRNVAATHVFVAHRGGVSFGSGGHRLAVRNLVRLNEIHPGYDRMVQQFLAADPLLTARRNIDRARLSRQPGTPGMLLVTHGLGGGTERNVRDLSDRLQHERITPYILRPLDARRIALQVPDEWQLPNLVFDSEQEVEHLMVTLKGLDIRHVHVHHFIGFRPNFFHGLLTALKVGYDVTIHDYSWICPQINLIDAGGRYCGEPELSKCEACLAQLGSQVGEVESVEALRVRSAGFLHDARSVFVPSRDVEIRMRRYAPKCAYHAKPHPEPRAKVSVQVPSPRQDGMLKVAVIGGISDHKGYRELMACAEDAASRKLPLRFIVIGHTRDDEPLFAFGNVFITGVYDENELPDLLAFHACDVALFLSVWPETWSYTLSAALSAGLLPYAYDIGAHAERIRTLGVGMLFPVGLSAPGINDTLLSGVTLNRKLPPRQVVLGEPHYEEMLSDYYALDLHGPTPASEMSAGTRAIIREVL